MFLSLFKIFALDGGKGLYSTSCFTPDEFWARHDQKRYILAKKTYDPDVVFPELYDKVVGKVTK